VEFHLVSHTHWDREWYRTAEEFRQRLVDLVDELIIDPPREGESFLLDGQAIVIEDYLDVKPANRERLRGLLQAGRLEAGPWYVLADELLPSGEALVRNLLVGRQVLESLGASSPPVLYCPDSFGHPAALPELAAGFGLPLIILWRGHGGKRSSPGDAFRWRAPSGRDAVVFHLPPEGYEFGSSLPTLPEDAARRWTRLREVLAPRASLGVSLIQNGADHHARQAGLRDAIAELNKCVTAGGDKLVVGSMRGFAEHLLSRAGAKTLRSVTGELRDSYGYTWTLQGTFGTRAAQKRANAIAERTLLRAERWCAVARLFGSPSRIDHLRAAWKTLLAAHPHDTLCGTSIDEVAAAMDQRLSAARRQGVALVKRGIEALVGYDPAAARSREQARPAPGVPVIEHAVPYMIANGVPYARGGVVIVREIEKLNDEPVGPGSGGPRQSGGVRVQLPMPNAQLLASGIGRHRIESPRHYPDNDIVRVSLVARYVAPQPGLTVRTAQPLDTVEPSTPVTVSRNELANGQLRARADKRGSLSLSSGTMKLDDLVMIEDRSDAGDSYTPSIGPVITWPKLDRQELVHGGPLIGELTQHWRLAPQRKRGAAESTIAVSLRVAADSPLLELRLRGVNRVRNHRIRIGIVTGLGGATVVADAAFGLVERRPLTVPQDDRRMETPPPTAPLHRYVSLFSKQAGVTIHSDGLAEYEADADGIVWITLVRAVGQLSRNDIPERPGHAGWPEPTPKAQSLGPFVARLAVQAHGPMSPGTLQLVERESDRFIQPLRGFTLRGSDITSPLRGGVELAGTGLVASAIKESEDGRAVVLRCLNLSGREQTGSWTLPVPLESAYYGRLDETSGQRIDPSEHDGRSTVEFTAGPRAVVTIVVTPRR
jgi:alpha-mannosidase